MNQTLVIGSAVVDVIIEIPHLPVTQEDVHITKQSRSLGGCAYLASDILRHFKAPSSLCTAVGGGIYGDYVRKHLTERGVPIYVSRPERENGCCYCMVEDGGERTFIVDHGVEYTFSEDYLENIHTESIDSVYVCGLEVEEVNGPEILAYLKKHPDYTVYFAPGARVMEIPQDRMETMLSFGPVLHMNEEEAMKYTGQSTAEEAARVLFEKTKNAVIITLGSRGSYCYDGEQDHYAALVPAESVQDTIGAGDSHIGSIMACRRYGLSYPESILAANHISSAVVSQTGGMLSPEAFAKALEGMPEALRDKLKTAMDHQ